MLKRTIVALALSLCWFADSAGAQVTRYNVACPYGLNSKFQYWQGVNIEGHWFETQWRSVSSVMPLPSFNWYYALPDRDPVSSDGRYRVEGARIQVHCFIARSMYGVVQHYDHVASLGRLVSCGPSRSNELDEEVIDGEVSDPSEVLLGSSCSGGSGGVDAQPEDEEWYEWYEGIRFRCQRTQDNTGTNVVSCVVDEP